MISNILENLFLYLEIYVFRVYKINDLPPNPIILDCGANKGVFALYCKKLFPNSRIVCVEPNPKTVGKLSKNIKKNPDIIIINKAITDLETVHISDNSFSMGNKLTNNPDDYEVEGITLDALIDSFKFDLIKIDIEGSEYEAILSSNLLAKCNRYMIELHNVYKSQDLIRKVIDKFVSEGFRIKYKFFCIPIPKSWILLFPQEIIIVVARN